MTAGTRDAAMVLAPPDGFVDAARLRDYQRPEFSTEDKE